MSAATYIVFGLLFGAAIVYASAFVIFFYLQGWHDRAAAKPAPWTRVSRAGHCLLSLAVIAIVFQFVAGRV